MTDDPRPEAAEDTGEGGGPDLDATDLSYADAVAELEAILRAVEAADVDVDALSRQVERAAQLLAFCRRRIRRAELRITDVLSGLEEETTWSDEESSTDSATD